MLKVTIERIGDVAVVHCEGRVVQSAAVFKLRDAVTQQGNARAGTVATSFDTNSPLKNTFIVSSLLLAPGSAGSAQAATTASNTAFLTGFNSGLNIGQIEAGPGGDLFSPPLFTNPATNIHYPRIRSGTSKCSRPSERRCPSP